MTDTAVIVTIDSLQAHLTSCQVCMAGIENQCSKRRELQERDMGWKSKKIEKKVSSDQ